MNVILMGYRGSGKTSVGKQLARELGLGFADVDQETCARFEGRTIAAIWQEFGEPAWRIEETRVTAELVSRDDHVIGLGGGTLMTPAARQAVERAADARKIYLYCDPVELHRRIQLDADTAATRPNLTNLGGGVEEIREVLAKRDPVYRAVAGEIIDVTHQSVNETVRKLARFNSAV